jgi:hypothetical protein
MTPINEHLANNPAPAPASDNSDIVQTGNYKILLMRIIIVSLLVAVAWCLQYIPM